MVRAAARGLHMGGLLLALLLLAAPGAASAADYAAVPGGTLTSVLALPTDKGPTRIAPFQLRVTPVTNAEYEAFVGAHPEWQRGRAPSAFVDGQYLHAWESSAKPGAGLAPNAPVTAVSWFGAQAFCENEGGRLPTWAEWEYVAAADATHADARKLPEWRAQILSWYAQSSAAALPAVGGPLNFYGVRDIHGLVWEWVDDFNALLVSADSRNQGDPDKLQFCGAGAISLQEKENYAILMRIALLSSLSAAGTTDNLGFRCARSAPGESK